MIELTPEAAAALIDWCVESEVCLQLPAGDQKEACRIAKIIARTFWGAGFTGSEVASARDFTPDDLIRVIVKASICVSEKGNVFVP